MRATLLVADVRHTVHSMLPAVCRHFTSLNVVVCLRGASALSATFAVDVNHAVRGMLPAVLRRLAVFNIEIRLLPARDM